MRANATLARHGRMLGPDPASAIACTVGGVVANNASGMTAGTTPQLVPHGRLADLRPADAARSSTRRESDADEQLAPRRTALCDGLLALKAEIEADQRLTARIRAKYEIKNTNGYRLDAFLDGATPVEILRGLMVGSEGTFGFISEVVFDTLPLDRHISSALLFFPSLHGRGGGGARVQRGGRDRRRADGRQHPARLGAASQGVPADWAGLPKGTAALLVEFRAPDESAPGRVRAGGRRRSSRTSNWSRRSSRSPTPSPGTPTTIARVLEGAQGVRDRGRRLPPLGHDADHRGLRRTAVPARRGLRGAARPPGRARLRRCRRGARGTRQSALPARLRRRESRPTSSGTPRSWTSSARSSSTASTVH